MKIFLLKSRFFKLFFLLINLIFASGVYSQTVTTDLLDYSPGSTAIITGAGFQAGETVTLLVEHVGEEPVGTDPQYHQPWTVVADSLGSFTSSWYVPTVAQGDALGATLLLTADGNTSLLHAEWTFTDAQQILSSIAAGAQTGSLTSGTAGSVSFLMTAGLVNNGGKPKVTYSVTSGLPIGATAPSVVSPNGSSDATLTVTTTVATPTGSYTLTISGSDDNNPVNTRTTTATLVVGGKITPTVTPIVGSYVYNGSPQGPNSATNTGTGTSYTYSYVGVSPTTYPQSSIQPTNAGNYTVTATVGANGNYNSASSLATAFSISKATPTATLAVNNSPLTYDGTGKSASVSISSSSVPGSVNSIFTGGVATQTNASTYAVTANFIPTDSANYNSLTGLSAGNFVISKATPTATLAVNNSPVTYDGTGKSATVSISSSSVPGSVNSILTGGVATQTNASTYAVTASFIPTDSANYNSLTGLSAGNFVINKAVAISNSKRIHRNI